MLTSWLVHRLDRSDNPRAIKLYSHLLERVTGVPEQAVLARFERKDTIIGSFDVSKAADWEEIRKYSSIYPSITRLLGSYSSYTGKAVNSDTALELSAVYACVKILGEDMGSLPFNFYERSADGKETRLAADDDRFRLLHDLANPDTSAGEFVEALTANAAFLGDGYAKIIRNQQGRPIWIYPITPDLVRIDRNSNNETVYQVKEKAGGVEIPYQREDIFHLKGFSFTGLSGDPLLSRARHILGIGSATQEYAGRFFANDASAGVILKRPVGAPTLGPEALKNLKEGWKLWHQGLSKSHEPAVLQEGTEAIRVDPDLEKLQIIPVRKFQIQEVARLFRMPLHKLADLERAIQSNIEQQAIEYSSNTLAPWVRRWKDAVHRCLLTRDEQIAGRLYAEHNLEAYVRGDFRTQAESFARLLEKGVYSINEVRRWLNLNPVEGGDKHYIQLNMAAIADAVSGENVDQGAKLRKVIEAPKEE